jgi:GMP synthase (glutamine-hydrolysing)
MTTICAIQHVPVEGLGLIADVLKASEITVELIRPFKGDLVPRRLGRHSGLVVMGGPMGVYDQHQYPFLRDELRLLEDALKEAKPILGVCLGSQLLAVALGAAVRKGKRKEIGWHRVAMTKTAADDELWSGLGPEFTAFHWHGDIFALPRDSGSLARSRLTECQSFRYGPSAYGLLCHLEVTESIVRRMAKAFPEELVECSINENRLFEKLATRVRSLRGVGLTVFGRWAQMVRAGAD